VSTHSLDSVSWWASRRWRYNRALIIAGIGAFACYAMAFQIRCIDVPGTEISGFTIAFQAIGYLVAMGLANLCFNLGHWSEALLRPSNPLRYRRLTYQLGLCFSVGLPFVIPTVILWFGCAP